MTSRYLRPPKLVMFDAGGVLVTPPLEAHRSLTNNLLSLEDVRRHFYAAYNESAIGAESNIGRFWEEYSDRLGLRGEPFRNLNSKRDWMIRWNSPAPGALKLLLELQKRKIPVAIVSNGPGDVEALLAEAGLCRVGESGPGAEVGLILDSGTYQDEELARKPNTTMLHDALRRFDVSPADALFVGDALWSDALAAHRMGVPFVHMNPYRDCENTEFPEHGLMLPTRGHEHVRNLKEVRPYALGGRGRGLVDAVGLDQPIISSLLD